MEESKKNNLSKIGWCCYAFVPMVAYFFLQIVVTIIAMLLMIMTSVITGNGIVDITSTVDINSIVSGVSEQLMLINSFIQVVAIIVFAVWYYFGCGRPSPRIPSGFLKGKHMVAICLTGVGTQFAVSVALNIFGELWPDLLKSYSDMMESAGVTEMNVMVFLSVVLLAPIVEEIIFRGLTFYIARRATKRFWIANIIQALAFGIMHANVVQGTYAFFMGLIMGWVYHRFHSLYASILLHFVINFTGVLVMEPLYSLLPANWLSLIVLMATGLLVLVGGLRMVSGEQEKY